MYFNRKKYIENEPKVRSAALLSFCWEGVIHLLQQCGVVVIAERISRHLEGGGHETALRCPDRIVNTHIPRDLVARDTYEGPSDRHHRYGKTGRQIDDSVVVSICTVR